MSTPSKLATLSPNFWFLGKENLQMVQIAAKAERALHDDLLTRTASRLRCARNVAMGGRRLIRLSWAGSARALG